MEDTAVYDSYGLLREDVDATTGGQHVETDPVGFGGQFGCYTDLETGLVLMTYRYYDAKACRFLTRDPAGYAAGVNPYAYCGGNPVMAADPLGLDPSSDAGPFIPGETTDGASDDLPPDEFVDAEMAPGAPGIAAAGGGDEAGTASENSPLSECQGPGGEDPAQVAADEKSYGASYSLAAGNPADTEPGVGMDQLGSLQSGADTIAGGRRMTTWYPPIDGFCGPQNQRSYQRGIWWTGMVSKMGTTWPRPAPRPQCVPSRPERWTGRTIYTRLSGSSLCLLAGPHLGLDRSGWARSISCCLLWGN